MEVVAWVAAVVARFGYAGVAFLTAVENVVPPVPSEVVLPLVGFAAARGIIGFWGAVTAATLGSVAGALALYALGRRVDPEGVARFADRRGRWLLLKRADVTRAEAWFRRNAAWAVFAGRLVPAVRSFVSIPAGSSRMGLPRFVVLTAAGSLLWNAVLLSLGYHLGSRWHLVTAWVGEVGAGVWLALGLLFVVFLTRRVWMRHAGARGGA